MLSKLLSYRPSHGTVVAYIALFIALGGTSYGFATGSIGSREIKNNSVRSKDIRNNDVRSKDIKDRAIRLVDLSRRTIESLKDISGYEIVGAPPNNIAPNEHEDSLAQCPEGKVAVGGGVFSSHPAEGLSPLTVATSAPLTPTSWLAEVDNRFDTPGAEQSFSAVVICVDGSPSG